ncbi:MAG: signal peptidase I [Patescibacteria group bacterium]
MLKLLGKALAAVFDFLQGIVAVAAVMVMIYLFVMSPQEVSGHSMEPNFQNGDYILTNKIIYKIQDPKRGDIVIFKSPSNKDIDYIKRVIGLPGETVMLKEQHFYINGKLLEEKYDYKKPVYGESFMQENEVIDIPQDHYFVIGDNRPGSSDSREFGPVNKFDFIGQAFLRYWPTSTVGLVPKPQYDF